MGTCRYIGSWVDTDIDVSLTKDDHRPARAILQWRAEGSTVPSHRELTKCPPTLCDEALTYLTYHTGPRIHLDVHTPFQSLQDEIASCTRHAPKDFNQKPKKQAMSENTWALVALSGSGRRILPIVKDSSTKLSFMPFSRAGALLWPMPQLVVHALPCPAWLKDFDQILAQLDVNIAMALRQFRSLGRQSSRL